MAVAVSSHPVAVAVTVSSFVAALGSLLSRVNLGPFAVFLFTHG